MNDKIDEGMIQFFILILSFCSLIAFGLGLYIGSESRRSIMQEKAIKYKAARYHPETAEFEWVINDDNTNN